MTLLAFSKTTQQSSFLFRAILRPPWPPPLSIRRPLIDGKVIKVTTERINANYIHLPVGLPGRSPVTGEDWRREQRAYRRVIGRGNC